MLDMNDVADRLIPGDSRLNPVERIKALLPENLFFAFLLFIVLFITYDYYVGWILKQFVNISIGKTDSSILEANIDTWLKIPHLLKFFLITGWPYALLAFIDKDWRYKDASKIGSMAWLGAFLLLIHQYGLNACPLGVLGMGIPFFMSGCLAHALGTWRHSATTAVYSEGE